MSKFRNTSVLPLGFVKSGDTVHQVYPTNKDGEPIVLNIDQFSGQSFMKNENGFIMNDIQAFNETRSDGIARAILSRCPVFKSDTREDGLSVEERLSEIIPENACSPAEFLSVSKRIATIRYNREQAKLEQLRAAQEVQLRKLRQPKKVDVPKPVETK